MNVFMGVKLPWTQLEAAADTRLVVAGNLDRRRRALAVHGGRDSHRGEGGDDGSGGSDGRVVDGLAGLLVDVLVAGEPSGHRAQGLLIHFFLLI